MLFELIGDLFVEIKVVIDWSIVRLSFGDEKADLWSLWNICELYFLLIVFVCIEVMIVVKYNKILFMFVCLIFLVCDCCLMIVINVLTMSLILTLDNIVKDFFIWVLVWR